MTSIRTQPYVSDELTHFTGRGKSESEQYATLVQILKSGFLKSPALIAGGKPRGEVGRRTLVRNPSQKICDGGVYLSSVVCFCDIPPSAFAIHMAKYSHFGVAFAKRWL